MQRVKLKRQRRDEYHKINAVFAIMPSTFDLNNNERKSNGGSVLGFMRKTFLSINHEPDPEHSAYVSRQNQHHCRRHRRRQHSHLKQNRTIHSVQGTTSELFDSKLRLHQKISDYFTFDSIRIWRIWGRLIDFFLRFSDDWVWIRSQNTRPNLEQFHQSRTRKP